MTTPAYIEFVADQALLVIERNTTIGAVAHATREYIEKHNLEITAVNYIVSALFIHPENYHGALFAMDTLSNTHGGSLQTSKAKRIIAETRQYHADLSADLLEHIERNFSVKVTERKLCVEIEEHMADLKGYYSTLFDHASRNTPGVPTILVTLTSQAKNYSVNGHSVGFRTPDLFLTVEYLLIDLLRAYAAKKGQTVLVTKEDQERIDAFIAHGHTNLSIELGKIIDRLQYTYQALTTLPTVA